MNHTRTSELEAHIECFIAARRHGITLPRDLPSPCRTIELSPSISEQIARALR